MHSAQVTPNFYTYIPEKRFFLSPGVAIKVPWRLMPPPPLQPMSIMCLPQFCGSQKLPKHLKRDYKRLPFYQIKNKQLPVLATYTWNYGCLVITV